MKFKYFAILQSVNASKRKITPFSSTLAFHSLTSYLSGVILVQIFVGLYVFVRNGWHLMFSKCKLFTVLRLWQERRNCFERKRFLFRFFNGRITFDKVDHTRSNNCIISYNKIKKKKEKKNKEEEEAETNAMNCVHSEIVSFVWSRSKSCDHSMWWFIDIDWPC